MTPLAPIAGDQHEILVIFEEGGEVIPPQGKGWKLWAACAGQNDEDGDFGVWLVWYRPKGKRRPS